MKAQILYVKLTIISLSVIMFYSQTANADIKQIIQGAGPSTKAAELFFKHFSELPVAKGYIFEVEKRSIKHAGGIKASEHYLFGRSGRPLTIYEKKMGKYDLFLSQKSIRLVVGENVAVKKINLNQLKDIMARQIRNWKELSGADSRILIVGRESTEAAFSIIKNKYSFFNATVFDVVLTRDHQVVNLIKSPKGSYAISFGIENNFDPKYLLEVEGFEAGVKLGLIVDVKNRRHPIVIAATEFANSSEWKTILVNSGMRTAH